MTERKTKADPAKSSANPDIETFQLHHKRTIDKLHRNGPGEEISVESYMGLLLLLLAERGYIFQGGLEAIIVEHYGRVFGPDDLRLCGPNPKWKNSLAWAKVQLGKKLLIAQRSYKSDGERKTVIVQTVANTDPVYLWYLEFVRSGPGSKRSFKKRCLECRSKNKLGARECGKCGTPFPLPSKRKHKLAEAG